VESLPYSGGAAELILNDLRLSSGKFAEWPESIVRRRLTAPPVTNGLYKTRFLASYILAASKTKVWGHI